MGVFLQFGVLAAVFVAVTAMALIGIERLRTLGAVQRRLTGDRDMSASSQKLIKPQNVTSPVLAWAQAAFADPNDGAKLARQLRRAGFEQLSAPILFVIVRLSLAIGLPLLFLVGQTLTSEPVVGTKLIFLALALCGAGFIAPQAIVDRMGSRRQSELENEFPDALDLTVVCVEAGLGMEAAFVKVGEETHESHPLISRQFGIVSQELRAGRSRAEALRNLGERTEVAAIRSFAALLIQTDSLGASIAQTLRIYSQEMRETRFVKAEEKAMRVPVLLTIPLVACILPVVVASLMLPAGIEVAQTLLPALRGTAR